MSAQLNFVMSRLSAVLREAIQYDYPPLAMEDVGIPPRPGDFDNYGAGNTEMVIEYEEIKDPGDDLSRANTLQTDETLIDLDFSKETVPVFNWFLTARYTLQEVEQAMRTQRNLPAKKVAAAMERGRFRHDHIAFQGNDFTKDSFANSDAVAVHKTIADGSQLTAADANKDTIISELSNFITSVQQESQDAHTVDRLAVTTALYGKLVSTYRDGTSTNLLNTIREAHGVEIVSINALTNMGTRGRAVAYSTNAEVAKNMLLVSPENLGVRDAKTFFEVPTRTQSAGFYWTKPLGARYMDGTG